jgi:hypothetical protein
MATEAEIAWAAGLFEGEGCFSVTTTKWGSLIPSMNLGMTDLDTVERYQSIVDSSRVRGPSDRGPGRKLMYNVDVAERASVRQLILAFLPWLGERRSRRAGELLAVIESLDAATEYRLEFCKRGHRWTEDNVYTAPSGIRACRQCKRDHGRSWMQQKRATNSVFHEQEKVIGRERARAKRASRKAAGLKQAI